MEGPVAEREQQLVCTEQVWPEQHVECHCMLVLVGQAGKRGHVEGASMGRGLQGGFQVLDAILALPIGG